MTPVSRPRRERPPKDFPRRTPEGYRIQWVRTSTLRQYCDPFTGCWHDISKPLRIEEVEQCLLAGDEQQHAPFPPAWAPRQLPEAQCRERHIQKIAWFARNGFTKPLEVDVGIPHMNCYVKWFVQDGNHRLAAGIVRLHLLGEDPWLPLSVGGSVDYAKQLGLW